jgi:hypothetical protein
VHAYFVLLDMLFQMALVLRFALLAVLLVIVKVYAHLVLMVTFWPQERVLLALQDAQNAHQPLLANHVQ